MKNFSTRTALVHVLTSAVFFMCGVTLAYGAPSFYENPIIYGGIKTVPELLLAIVDLVFLIAVPIIVMCIIYSGFLFVTSGGNDAKIEKARHTFLWTVVGALVLLGAKAIALAVQATIDALK